MVVRALGERLVQRSISGSNRPTPLNRIARGAQQRTLVGRFGDQTTSNKRTNRAVGALDVPRVTQASRSFESSLQHAEETSPEGKKLMSRNDIAQ
jgi:hypothetical protein